MVTRSCNSLSEFQSICLTQASNLDQNIYPEESYILTYALGTSLEDPDSFILSSEVFGSLFTQYSDMTQDSILKNSGCVGGLICKENIALDFTFLEENLSKLKSFLAERIYEATSERISEDDFFINFNASAALVDIFNFTTCSGALYLKGVYYYFIIKPDKHFVTIFCNDSFSNIQEMQLMMNIFLEALYRLFNHEI